MCTLYIERSAMSCTGQSDDSQIVKHARAQAVTWTGVTTGVPGVTTFRPIRSIAIQ